MEEAAAAAEEEAAEVAEVEEEAAVAEEAAGLPEDAERAEARTARRVARHLVAQKVLDGGYGDDVANVLRLLLQLEGDAHLETGRDPREIGRDRRQAETGRMARRERPTPTAASGSGRGRRGGRRGAARGGAHHVARRVERRPARVARVDGGVDLDREQRGAGVGVPGGRGGGADGGGAADGRRPKKRMEAAAMAGGGGGCCGGRRRAVRSRCARSRPA